MQHTAQTATDQVRNNNSEDYENVLRFATTWISRQSKPFTAEHLKVAYLAVNEPVLNQNVYGSVFYNLSKNNMILESGVTKAKLTKAHGRLLRVWATAGMQLSIV